MGLILFLTEKSIMKTDIARKFSLGEFKGFYPYLTESTVWDIVGEKELNGRNDIIKHCESVRNYFDSVTTDFTLLKIFEDHQHVTVTGIARFIRDNQVVAVISSCDVYTFLPDFTLKSIHSYCIKH